MNYMSATLFNINTLTINSNHLKSKVMAKHPGVDYHRMAAEHHEKAALHHKKAADYYEIGNIKKAEVQAELAEVFHRQANEHLQNKHEESNNQHEHHEQFYS